LIAHRPNKNPTNPASGSGNLRPSPILSPGAGGDDLGGERSSRATALSSRNKSGTYPEPDLETCKTSVRDPRLHDELASARRDKVNEGGNMNRKALQLVLVAGLVLVTSALRADERCSTRSVAGDFGFTVVGTRLPVGPAASVGSVHFDRDGNLTGSQTLSIGGTIVQGEVLTGTYTVDADCAGSATIVVSNTPFPRTAHLDVVWINSSDEFRAIFADTGLILTVDGKRIHHGND
jgi:hypothetical protein